MNSKSIIATTIGMIIGMGSAFALIFNSPEISIGSGSSQLTNTVTANSTNTMPGVYIDAQKYNTIGIALRTKLDAAGTAPITYVYKFTPDGSNFVTGTSGTLTVTPTGTISVNTATNISCTGMKGFKIIGINNGNAANLTNLQGNVVYKGADQPSAD